MIRRVTFNYVKLNKMKTMEGIEDIRKKELEDLKAMAEILKLQIIREETFEGVQTIVVDNGKGEEVHGLIL
jgi:hypothetical protein